VLAPPPVPAVFVSFFAVVVSVPDVVARREAWRSPRGGVFSIGVLAEDLDAVSL
jgi:hypothetical protein